MSKKTIIDKVKAMFSEETVETPAEIKFLDLVTADGVAIKINEEELVEGVVVYVVDEEGNEVVAPEGEHTVEDKVITLDENGVVISIVEVEAPAEEEEVADEAPVEEEMEAVVEETVAEVEVATEEEVIEEDVVDEVNETESRIAAIEKAIADMAHHFSAVTELQKQVNDLAGKPADAEIKLSKTSGEAKKMDTFSKLKEISKYRKL